MRQHSTNLSQPTIGSIIGSKAYSLPSKRKKQPKRLAESKSMSQAEWLKVRKQGIGSSDCAAACGLNPYMSMLGLWMIKTGRIQQNIEDENDGHAPLYWGKRLEPLVAEYYSMHTNYKVRRVNAVLQILNPINTLCWQTWTIPWWVMRMYKFWNVKRLENMAQNYGEMAYLYTCCAKCNINWL